MKEAGRSALGTLALVLAAIVDRGAAAGAPAAAAQVQQGKALYADHCSHCHGFGMVNAGNVVPDLREFPSAEKERFVDTVIHGKSNRMPPWGDVLSPSDINALWAYVRTGGK